MKIIVQLNRYDRILSVRRISGRVSDSAGFGLEIRHIPSSETETVCMTVCIGRQSRQSMVFWAALGDSLTRSISYSRGLVQAPYTTYTHTVHIARM